MKTPRLPETDLFRIAPLPTDQKRLELAKMAFGPVCFSYQPFRDLLPDIFIVRPPLIFDLHVMCLEDVLSAVKKKCRSEKETSSNITVTTLLFNKVREKEFFSESFDFGRLPLFPGESLRFWLNAVVVVEGSLYVIGIDPRRTRYLTLVGRDFALSVMKLQIEQFDDLRSATPVIYQMPLAQNGARFVRESKRINRPYSYEEVMKNVTETYAIWTQLQEEKSWRARSA